MNDKELHESTKHKLAVCVMMHHINTELQKALNKPEVKKDMKALKGALGKKGALNG